MRKRARLLSPQSLEDFNKGRGALIAFGMRQQFDAHHTELGGTPAADDVDAPAALSDMIQRPAHLGRHERVKNRNVDG